MARLKRTADTAITPIEYSGLQEAYDHFNRELFDGKLPDVFITYQRKAHSLGYFGANRFAGRLTKTARHELALNPDGFVGKVDKEICSSLVHEQHHVWEHVAGTASSRGYHGKQWSAKMIENGLQPSSTGMPGGRETGQRMSHYIIPGGKFEQGYERLAATGWKLNLESAHRPGEKKGPDPSKTKFVCPACDWIIRGKPDTGMWCEQCGAQALQEQLGSAAGAVIRLLKKYRMQADAPVAAPAPSPSYEPTPPDLVEPAKRKRGRPKGSKNKIKADVASYDQQPPQQPAKRGRPKGSENKPKGVLQSYDANQQGPVIKRKPGRPKGSKNKPKQLQLEA